MFVGRVPARGLVVSGRRISYFCLLPSAFCLLPSAFCLLLSAFCFLPSAFCLCLLLSAFCLLPSAFTRIPAQERVLPQHELSGSAAPPFLRSFSDRSFNGQQRHPSLRQREVRAALSEAANQTSVERLVESGRDGLVPPRRLPRDDGLVHGRENVEARSGRGGGGRRRAKARRRKTGRPRSAAAAPVADLGNDRPPHRRETRLFLRHVRPGAVQRHLVGAREGTGLAGRHRRGRDVSV